MLLFLLLPFEHSCLLVSFADIQQRISSSAAATSFFYIGKIALTARASSLSHSLATTGKDELDAQS